MAIIYCAKENLIEISFISNLSKYLSLREYILMYVIIVTISRIISIKFSKKLFKNTAMNTYNEEV